MPKTDLKMIIIEYEESLDIDQVYAEAILAIKKKYPLSVSTVTIGPYVPNLNA